MPRWSSTGCIARSPPSVSMSGTHSILRFSSRRGRGMPRCWSPPRRMTRPTWPWPRWGSSSSGLGGGAGGGRNPRHDWLFKPERGIDVSLDQADVLAHLIEEEMSLGDMMPLLKLRRGKYSFVEEKVPPGAPAIGPMIKDLDLPENCVIAGIIPQGDVVVPRGVTTSEEEDAAVAVGDRAGSE